MLTVERVIPNRLRASSVGLGAGLLLAMAGGATSIMSTQASAAPLFAAPFLSFDAGGSPAFVAIGDLNGDGKPDLVTANDPDVVTVRLNTTGLCTVPNVKGKTLPRAKRAVVRAHCRVGKVRHAYSKIVKPGRVMSERPKPGTVLRKGGKVNLVVSRGRKR